MELTPAGFHLAEKICDLWQSMRAASAALGSSWDSGLLLWGEPFADGDGSSLNVQISMVQFSSERVEQVERHETIV